MTAVLTQYLLAINAGSADKPAQTKHYLARMIAYLEVHTTTFTAQSFAKRTFCNKYPSNREFNNFLRSKSCAIDSFTIYHLAESFKILGIVSYKLLDKLLQLDINPDWHYVHQQILASDIMLSFASANSILKTGIAIGPDAYQYYGMRSDIHIDAKLRMFRRFYTEAAAVPPDHIFGICCMFSDNFDEVMMAIQFFMKVVPSNMTYTYYLFQNAFTMHGIETFSILYANGFRIGNLSCICNTKVDTAVKIRAFEEIRRLDPDRRIVYADIGYLSEADGIANNQH